MALLGLLIAALFLPLFPLSMLFNRLFVRLQSPWLRIGVLLVWPQFGVIVLSVFGIEIPHWVAYWAVLTALLYAFRALAVRELGLWTAFIATSAWALSWLVLMFQPDSFAISYTLFTMSIPFLLLAWLTFRLEALFGSAFAGVSGGIAQQLPRLSLLLVLSVLAAVASPVFPGFFVLIGAVAKTLGELPLAALGLVSVWMLWAWSGTRITHAMIVGAPCDDPKTDLDLQAFLPPAVLISLLLVAGLLASGYLL